MSTGNRHFRFLLAVATVLVLVLMLVVAMARLEFDFDVAASLPPGNPAISGARFMLRHHPMQDRVVIDIAAETADPELLVKAGDIVAQELRNSNLFKSVGFDGMQRDFPALMQHLVADMPILFSRRDLEQNVRPMLAPYRVKAGLVASLNQLAGMEGVGRGDLISHDPLGITGLILQKISRLSPAGNARFYKGHLISADNRHLLLMASPIRPGTDTAFSRILSRKLATMALLVERRFHQEGAEVALTFIGTYRAALDNELTAKADTRRAILFAVAGIALLLLFSFPRPWIGLLALLPALAGTVIALFLFSVIHDAISVLTLGFGGAIISITVDHAITYFLFLDQPRAISARDAARETRAVCLLALLTTVGAFLTLSISGFSILSQIGQFAALGIAGSFIFLHTLFPLLIPELQPARRQRLPLLQRIIGKPGRSGSWKGVAAALVFASVMAVFAMPRFNVDLSSINTVRTSTATAEKEISRVWGDVFSSVYMALEADSPEELQNRSDLLLNRLEADVSSGQLQEVFTASLIFPGEGRARQNFSAWRSFWNQQRVSDLKREIRSVSAELGFAPDAFNPFFHQLTRRQPPSVALPERFAGMLGISKETGSGKWIQFLTLKPGDQYNAADFFKRYQQQDSIKLFDARYFSTVLGRFLMSTFLKMVIIVGIAVLVLVFIFFLSWRLTLIAALPVLFAMVSTLGTLNLLGHPLGIPGLMLSIVVIGMGVDYALFFVLSYQRYGDENHPSLALIRMAVFLASTSTLIGFGVLNLADHRLLKSAGLVSVLGIGYALLGAFVILPPILRKLFITDRDRPLKKAQRSASREKRVLSRYANLEAHPRMFARFKLRLDPMFPEIDRYVDRSGRILDIGCGIGVPACWILDRFPSAEICSMDPDPERARIAGRVIGDNGTAVTGGAPDLPFTGLKFDLALLLDMIHYLDDNQLRQTLERIRAQLLGDGKIIIRVTIPTRKSPDIWRRIETTRLKILRQPCYFRSEQELRFLLDNSGFRTTAVDPSGNGREETWFVAEISGGGS